LDETCQLLIEQAFASRPELKQSHALIAAAHDSRDGAVYGPLIPSLGAQVFGGGLGGGPDGGPSHFGAEGDYLVGLSWRIGPGGLFDQGRVHASKARLAQAGLTDSKLHNMVSASCLRTSRPNRMFSAHLPITSTPLPNSTRPNSISPRRSVMWCIINPPRPLPRKYLESEVEEEEEDDNGVTSLFAISFLSCITHIPLLQELFL
jgi:hypothetical protein